MDEALHRRLLSSAPLSAATAARLLAQAALLRHDDVPPLKGMNIALLCGSDADGAAARLRQAATGIGARVSSLQPAPEWLQGPERLGPDTLRLLVRLYDAVACEAMPRGFGRALQRRLAIPVLEDLARADHPLLALRAPAGEATPDARSLLQAALVAILR